MSPEKDFDINSWEAGANNHAAGEDFDIGKWENANVKAAPSPTSVEGRPQIQRPAPPTLSPDEEMPVSQAEQDSIGAAQTAKQLGGPAAVGAGAAMAGPMVLAMAPEVVNALSAGSGCPSTSSQGHRSRP